MTTKSSSKPIHRNEKILVTGGAGFIGSEVVKQLLLKRYRVRVVDDLSSGKNDSLPRDIEFIQGDLVRKEVALKALKGVDKCIHLAAKVGGLKYHKKYPATILSSSNKIQSSVFEAASFVGIERMVYISSSMVFDLNNKSVSREEDVDTILPPVSAYGFSKLIGERYCKAFKEEFGLNYAIIRPFNVYGVIQKKRGDSGISQVIPDLTSKILSGQYPLEIFGSGNQTRCFTHVSDVARGIIMAMEKKKALNQDFNISSDKQIKIIDLARLLWRICGRKEKFKVERLKTFDLDIRKRIPSVIKARKLLGWEPKVPLEEGLSEVVVKLRKSTG